MTITIFRKQVIKYLVFGSPNDVFETARNKKPVSARRTSSKLDHVEGQPYDIRMYLYLATQSVCLLHKAEDMCSYI